jgi:hypothetical protein
MADSKTIGTIILVVIASVIGFTMGEVFEGAVQGSNFLYDSNTTEYTTFGSLAILFYYLALILLPLGVMFTVLRQSVR